MRRAGIVVLSALLWLVSWIHFVVMFVIVIVLYAILGEKRSTWLLRGAARNIARVAGGRVETRYAPGFDRHRTCFFVSNHVNLFDPFVLASAIPQRARGLELESHFRMPVYGWLMRRLGNVPVPDERSAAALKRTYRLTGNALARGTSLVVFPEGSRTLDGQVGPFEPGVFRMAKVLGYPITPVTIDGSFRWKRKGSWLLRPGRVVVHFHDTIDVGALDRSELRGLADKVRAIVAGPLEPQSTPTAR